MNLVKDCLDYTEQKLKPLLEEEAELQKRLDEIATEKKPLEEAVELYKARLKKKTKGSRKPAPPSVKKEDVRPVCFALVAENSGIKREKLEELVEEKLVHEQGFSRNGLKMQLRKCLESELFDIADDQTVSVAPTIDQDTLVQSE